MNIIQLLKRMPEWLWYTALTILLWGAWGVQSKVVLKYASPWANQIFFPIGLAPVVVPLLFNRKLRAGGNIRRGAAWALLTGLLGGVGNVAFFLALDKGGPASVVVPITCMAPLVTVLLAGAVLSERITRAQKLGVAVSILAIVLLGE